jgi:hypothetical protein
VLKGTSGRWQRMQAHCAMNVKNLRETESSLQQNEQKWFRTVLRRLKNTKFTQPEIMFLSSNLITSSLITRKRGVNLSVPCCRCIHISELQTNQAHISRQPDSPPPPPAHYPSLTFDSGLDTSSGKKSVYPVNDNHD